MPGGRWTATGLVAAIVIAVTLVVAGYGGGLIQRNLTVAFIVPDNYTGYLVTRWECPGGIALARSRFGGWQDLTVEFDARGTACIADSIPGDGFRVAGFRFANGEAAPAIVGGTRGLQGNRPVGELEFVFSPLASIGIGNGQILGDECSLQEFLTARFGGAPRYVSPQCEPVFTLPNPALPLTPGLPFEP